MIEVHMSADHIFDQLLAADIRAGLQRHFVSFLLIDLPGRIGSQNMLRRGQVTVRAPGAQFIRIKWMICIYAPLIR
jgi:hypothetical protein